MPAKPCPRETNFSPLKKMWMSSQCTNESVIARNEGASASRKLSSVSSENTTPKPQVTLAGLRSKIFTSQPGCAFFESRPK